MSRKKEQVSVEQPNGKRPRTEAVVRDELVRAVESKILKVLRGGRKLNLAQIDVERFSMESVAQAIGINPKDSEQQAVFMNVWERVIKRITTVRIQERFTRELTTVLRGNVFTLSEIAARLSIDVAMSPISLEYNALLDTLSALRFPQDRDPVIDVAPPHSGRGEWGYYLVKEAKELELAGKLTKEYMPRSLEERVRG